MKADRPRLSTGALMTKLMRFSSSKRSGRSLRAPTGVACFAEATVAGFASYVETADLSGNGKGCTQQKTNPRGPLGVRVDASGSRRK